MRLPRALSVLLALSPLALPAGSRAMTIIVPTIDLSPLEAHGSDDANPCLAAASATEHGKALPQDLLGAIGRVESGRWDPVAHRVVPWPWTVNAQGAGRMFASAQQAVAYVTSLQARGVRSIDVGCFQVNLLYHPAAFASLDQAFDPGANAAYAADFLGRLHSRSGSWEQAVGDYHSQSPSLGEPYRRRVLLSLAGWELQAAPMSTSEPRPRRRELARHDRFTILSLASTRAIVVLGPGSTQPTAYLMPQSHMPRVFRP